MTPHNPYAPTAKTLDLISDDPTTAARRELGRPATAIIIMASIHSVLESISLIKHAILTFQGVRIDWALVIPWLILFIVHVFQSICAANMGHLKSLRLAYVGAILATIPILSPLVVLGIPFGIWAIVLLGKPRIREAFKLSSAHYRVVS